VINYQYVYTLLSTTGLV